MHFMPPCPLLDSNDPRLAPDTAPWHSALAVPATSPRIPAGGDRCRYQPRDSSTYSGKKGSRALEVLAPQLYCARGISKAAGFKSWTLGRHASSEGGHSTAVFPLLPAVGSLAAELRILRLNLKTYFAGLLLWNLLDLSEGSSLRAQEALPFKDASMTRSNTHHLPIQADGRSTPDSPARGCRNIIGTSLKTLYPALY